MTNKILIGNAFPLVLVRRKVTVEPVSLEMLKTELEGKSIVSFWGHDNSVNAASDYVGLDLKPDTARPVLELDSSGLPCFNNESYSVCWIISPNYRDNHRPGIGEEVSSKMIESWQILKIIWDIDNKG